MSEIAIAILKKFLDANGTAVSGDQIAQELGISRAGVWNYLKNFRAEGFDFEASTRVGYRLKSTPAGIHADLLSAHLRRKNRTPPVFFFDAVDSTNSAAERLLSDEKTMAPIVVIAAEQRSGRGRLGRVWHSEKNGNAYISLGFHPLIAPEKMQAFTLAMGLRLCDFLAKKLRLPLQIKWPNDLLCGGKKIAGILTEARIDADHVRDLVFGIGVNINSRPADFPEELRDTAGSLAAAAGVIFDINAMTAEIVETLFCAYENFIANGRGDDFETLWQRYDFLAKKNVTVSIFGRTVSGAVCGLDGRGALLLRDDTGVIHTLNAGEVTLRRN